ncbi:MAG: purine-nucleoside phosphorylase [Gemmatimonadetes bacterium]|nr:purine-nucleoside phosphorylase [Gemmatimonadota bacterium]NNM05647.1 purine-nucleoside phosphorylase [Gemmatimonadota bacterium]
MEKAVEAVRSRLHGTPEVFVVLGSGLSGLADGVSGGVSIPFREVPGFPEPTVPGHTGRLVFGEVEGKKVLLQAGRFHFYEGHNSDVVVAPVRMAAGLGVRSVLLTNAAGSVSSGLVTGSIMMIEDHVNFMARSPLAGPVLEGEQRFPDMSQPYDATLRGVAREAARELGIDLPEGVYAAVLGPSYETPAEIRLLRGVGADAVGMSTVPEAIAARASGLRVLAFSVITNQAAGLSKDPLNHDEVLEMGKVSGGRLEKLLRVILGKM